ncbi:protein croquemort-like isoform X1 [Homarus americanus]|uniref:protein croquemort-like isoform X1 n=1 Tax=Homarus americanus TaxID=6706 RepID=UPI001C4942DD|nr:protein croquemort-like isoform X1 [Homarus americanus]XP_042220673.1 protein croquemort-like isoform X1 [Homarus americanus]XP_042220675.1 protein croquemort-like isoform X1 [Homarus americanus]XP_042220676.1 protein croquemort-like isoform X1 [Homarus americanus]
MEEPTEDVVVEPEGGRLKKIRDAVKENLAKLRWLTGCQIAVMVMALVVLILCVAMLAGCYQATLQSILHSQLEIREGSQSYKVWKETQDPLLLKLYLFNLTNPKQFQLGHKPVLQECGPFVWREYHKKQNLTFHPNNTVTYQQQRWWIWDQELSGNNTQDDVIVSVNTIPVSAAWALRDSSLAQIILNVMFNEVGEKLFVTSTVSEIMFTGVKDPVLEWIQENVVAKNGSYHTLLPFFGPNSAVIKYDKFAWFYQRNMSMDYDGLFNMKTGVDTLENLGIIDWWNQERETPFFSPPCNHVTGSAGELFPPHPGKDHIIFYSSDLCMSMKLFYKEDITDVAKLQGYRFWGSNHTFANGSVVSGNECYCVKHTCAPTGLVNAESCRMGAPAFVSFPHFLNADPFLLDGVSGLDPQEGKHSFIIDIVPELGVPMKVAARLQINLRVLPYPQHGKFHIDEIDILKSVPDVYLPMLWFEILADITQDQAGQLNTLVYILQSPILNTIIWCVLLSLALLTLVLVLVVHYWRNRNRYNMVNSTQ